MSYKPYPSYKDSGVEWLGDIPEEWEVYSLRNAFSLIRNGCAFDQDVSGLGNTVKVTRIETISEGKINYEKTGEVAFADQIQRYRLDYGDISFSNINSLSMVGNVAIKDDYEELYAGMNLLQMRPKEGQWPKYLLWVFRDSRFRGTIEANAKPAINQASIPVSKLSGLPIPKVPLPTQKAIAAFLDARTARIDDLVQDYEELVSLLKEKRQALVSHAVTRGLSELVSPDDPDFGEWSRPVTFKDPGVEWMGEIPEGWELKKLSFLFKAKKGSNAAQLTKEYCASIEGEYPVYSGQTENDGVMASINIAEFDSGSDGYLFSTTVGAKAMSLMHIKGKFSLSQNCMVIIPITNTTDVRFQYYHMQPLFSYERGLIPEHMQASFRMEDLYKYRLALPPIPIQKAIAAFLDRETAKLDALVTEAEGAIELLKEHRSALITAAVTGKINVEGVDVAQP